jgi:hypothetical protein
VAHFSFPVASSFVIDRNSAIVFAVYSSSFETVTVYCNNVDIVAELFCEIKDGALRNLGPMAVLFLFKEGWFGHLSRLRTL